MGTYTRKILRIGGSRCIALPRPWLDQVKISEGDTVIVTEQGGSLVIRKVKGDDNAER